MRLHIPQLVDTHGQRTTQHSNFSFDVSLGETHNDTRSFREFLFVFLTDKCKEMQRNADMQRYPLDLHDFHDIYESHGGHRNVIFDIPLHLENIAHVGIARNLSHLNLTNVTRNARQYFTF